MIFGAADALHVERLGDGPPLVLFHGLGASGRYWERLTPLLRERHAVVVPDLLGFGRSPKPSGAAYDVESHLGALRPLVPEGSTLVGHSMGAVLAAALAVASPALVANVVLIGLPAYPSAEVARAEIGRLGLLARLTVAGSPWARFICESMCALRPVALALGPIVVRDLPREIVQDGFRHSWRSYSCTLTEVVVHHRAVPDLSRVGMPTLLVHGRSDEEAPVSHVTAAAAAARASGRQVDLEVVDGDHHLAIRRPELIAEAIETLVLGRREHGR